MIQSIAIRNFQSIRKLDIDLSGFTVIVGPSSSGKSAFMRALKALISNSWERDNVSVGATSTAIQARTERGTVKLERAGRANDRYVLDVDGAIKEYTKLGGSVPEAVTAFLGIDPIKNDQSTNFAGQHDRPYLLTDSGGSVAAKLGALTNVGLLFDASREANRRKLETSKLSRLREADLTALSANLSDFQGLPDRLRRLADLEAKMSKLEQIAAMRDKLDRTITTVEVAQAALDSAQRELDTLSIIDIDLVPIQELRAQSHKLTALIGEIQALDSEIAVHQAELAAATKGEEAAKAEYQQYLIDQGSCPVCGASAEHYHTERIL